MNLFQNGVSCLRKCFALRGENFFRKDLTPPPLNGEAKIKIVELLLLKVIYLNRRERSSKLRLNVQTFGSMPHAYILLQLPYFLFAHGSGSF